MATSNDEPIAESPGDEWPVLAELVEVVKLEQTPTLLAPLTERQASDPFGVPSRFGIGTLLVVTAAYGALLSLLLALDWDRRAIVWMIVFISLVGAGQMFLFGSRRPRQASLLTGAVSLPVILVLATILHQSRRGPGYDLCCGIISATMFGAPAGYLAGGVVAGVFLIMDAVQRELTRLFPPKVADKEDQL